MSLRIKVGHLVYNLRPLPPLMQDSESAVGLHSPDDATLFVTPEVNAPEQVRILWHELFHAMCHAFAIEKKPRDEEGVCLAFETPLVNLIRDNPKMLAAMRAAFDEDKPLVTSDERVVRNRKR